MNHLRELLEALTTGEIAYERTLPRAVVIEAAAYLRSTAPRVQCFWLGDVEALGELPVLPDIARLPFDDVWVEGTFRFDDGDSVVGLMASQRGDGRVDCVGCVRDGRMWQLVWVAESLGMADGEFVFFTRTPATVEMAQISIWALRAFCCAINCTNVTRQEHVPAANLQKARAKRGKQPLFSYWTLQLNGRAVASEGVAGGTHASPRVHLRRGHPRQYAPGKWTWVQAHAVGNRAAGMVHKDYSAGPGLKAQ